MIDDILKNIADKSYGLLPTPKSVKYSIISLLVVIFSIFLIWFVIKSNEPKKPDLSNLQIMKPIYEKEYLLNKAKQNK